MSFFIRNKFLLFIVLLLVVTNITTVLTVRYKTNDRLTPNVIDDNITNHQRFQRGMHFKDELGLTDEQFQEFQQLRRTYNPIVRRMMLNMRSKRVELLDELSKENPDTIILNKISRDIGDMHTEMKIATNSYFIKMKHICTPEQQLKLIDVFKSMLGQQGNMGKPDRGMHNRFGARGKNRVN